MIVSDENAPIKVVRIRIVDDSGGQGAPAGGLEEGDELGAIKPQAGGDGQVGVLVMLLVSAVSGQYPLDQPALLIERVG